MPLTFPSHSAAVLPIKLASPGRWDGVALVVGSTAPDLPYAVWPYLPLDAHAWPALLWFCLPATLIGTWIIRRAAPVVAAHLPGFGGFALRDYGVLGRVRHRWYVTGWSAAVGAATHLFWDSFTHSSAVRTWPFLPLSRVAVAGVPWWSLLQQVSTVVGALVAAGFAWRIGRRRLLVAWHGPPPPVTVRPRVFWSVAAVAGAAGLAVVPLLRDSRLSNVGGVRLLVVAAVAMLAAAVGTRIAPVPRHAME